MSRISINQLLLPKMVSSFKRFSLLLLYYRVQVLCCAFLKDHTRSVRVETTSGKSISIFTIFQTPALQLHQESNRRHQPNGRCHKTPPILLLGKFLFLQDRPIRTSLAHSLRLLSRTPPPHGAFTQRAPHRRLLADSPHPQRS